MKKILVIPHIGLQGGAGLYINQLVTEISNNFDAEIYVGGKYSKDYNLKKYNLNSTFNKLIAPNYKGIRSRVRYYHLLKSILFLPNISIRLSRHLSRNDFFDVIILTSSIQILLVPTLKKYFKNTKLIILIQENLELENHLAILFKMFLKDIDLIVSITDSWSKYAKTHKIDSIVLRNLYPAFNVNNTLVSNKEFDFIYLGGDQRIKGFDDFVVFCKKISEVRNCKIAFLGHISESNKDYLLKSLEHSDFDIDIKIFGFLNDIHSVLIKSKVLLLPIASPHFCRPAIEAGFFNIPFIIKRHEGIGDFAIEGYNCEMYYTAEDFRTIAISLLERPQYTNELGKNNFSNSQKFIHKSENTSSFLKAFREILNE